MSIFKNRLSASLDRRKVADRRVQEKALPYNRRVTPDRRLNNISVEWVPISEVNMHPDLREALSSHRKNKK